MTTKVLIGIVTYDKHSFVFPKLHKSIKAIQEKSDADVLFVDNSEKLLIYPFILPLFIGIIIIYYYIFVYKHLKIYC